MNVILWCASSCFDNISFKDTLFLLRQLSLKNLRLNQINHISLETIAHAARKYTTDTIFDINVNLRV